ncbi:endonuclease/exonuclease/phosphatase family protein [Catenulispora subtropica]|uniref:Endonuclease/exonuclease/phosphatase domain-containing protein n=1 Tax=Catenulispora subtropica TaxID=450798 RepID=A0ABP5D6D9_9ACTN
MRFDQLQPGSDDDGPIAQGTAGPVTGPEGGAETGGAGTGGALVRVEPAAAQAPRIDGIELPRAGADEAGPQEAAMELGWSAAGVGPEDAGSATGGRGDHGGHGDQDRSGTAMLAEYHDRGGSPALVDQGSASGSVSGSASVVVLGDHDASAAAASTEHNGAVATLAPADHGDHGNHDASAAANPAEHNGAVATVVAPSDHDASAAANAADQTGSVAVAAKPAVPVGPAVLAVSEIIRTAADQAAATWRVASVPAQRRESPVVPFQSATAPTPTAPTAPPQPPASPPPPAEPAFVPEPESPEPESASSEAASPESASPGPQPASPEPALHDDSHHWPSARRQISLLVRVVCVLVTAVLLGHRFLPDVMGFGSLIDTFLPWTFVPLVLAVPAALLSLDRWAIGLTVLACGVWGGDFGPQLVRSGGSGPADLRVLSQNVSSPPDLSAVADLALRQQADIVVLQGLTSRDAQQADQSVPERFPYHLAMYEFAVWSRFPLVNGSLPMDLGAGAADPGQVGQFSGSTSGQFGGLLRFTVQLDPVRAATVFAVHLPQPSLSHDGFGVARGDALEQLVAAVKDEKEPNLVVVGDLDLAQTDRGMGSLVNSTTGLVSVQAEAGEGFGFTWPSKFPMVRLDDVLTRGLTPVRSVVLPAIGPEQAHRPIVADLRFAAGDPGAASAPSTPSAVNTGKR